MDTRVQELAEQVNGNRKYLAETKWPDFTKGLEGWEKGTIGQLVENQAKHIATMAEDTRTAAIGSFEKFIFPLIRTVWPNLASQELVSVQPMEGPISMLFYLDFLAGTSKGNINKGDVMIDARTGMREEAKNYAAETVDLETIYNGSSLASGTPLANLSWTPIRPGTVAVTFVDAGSNEHTFYDNGNGSATYSSGGVTWAFTVNYLNGAIALTWNGGSNIGPVQATYDVNQEGPDFANNTIPQMDASLTSAPVVARPMRLRARWSVDVAAQLRAIHGLEAEMELTEALAQQIRFGIDNKIINDLWKVAGAGTLGIDLTPPGVNIPWFTHQMGFMKELQTLSNMIFKATRRGFGNWVVCGVDAATIFESHPLFESSGNQSGPGVVFSGVFAGRWKVFKNPYLTSTDPKGFGSSSFIVGYKGDKFFDAGYVYAPWIPFYQTPTVVLDDLMFRKAVMTYFGVKVVNGLFYSTGNFFSS